MPGLIRKLLKVPEWLWDRAGGLIWLRGCNTVGRQTQAFWRPNIDNRGRIDIGSNVRINSRWAPAEIVTGAGGTVTIEDGVYVNYGTLISAQATQIRIGQNVMIGNYSIIADTDIPGIEEPPGRPQLKARPIEIGADAWLAARVTVLPGSRIGARAIIAAGSVVSGEIPADAVAGGIPARVLRAGAAEARERSAEPAAPDHS